MEKEVCWSQSWRMIIWCKVAAPLRAKIYQSSAPLRRSTRRHWMSPLKWSLGIRRIQSDDLEHRVGRLLSRFSNRLNWESPTPSPAGECVCVCTVYPSPFNSFLHKAAQNFEVFSNIQEWNKKIKNLCRLMSFSRPIQWYHCHVFNPL